MSSGKKVPLAQAQLVAIQALQLLTKNPVPLDVAGAEKVVRDDPDAAVEDVLVVGSVRRGSPEVGDVELVCLPRVDKVPVGQADIFGNFPTEERSRLWTAFDAAVASGEIVKGSKNGPKFRQCSLDGVTIDLFTAEAGSFGHTVLVRTGGAMFSKLYMQVLKRLGLASVDNRIEAQTDGARKRFGGSVIPVRTEHDVFRVLGIPYLPPDRRGALPGDSETIALRRWFGGVR